MKLHFVVREQGVGVRTPVKGLRSPDDLFHLHSLIVRWPKAFSSFQRGGIESKPPCGLSENEVITSTNYIIRFYQDSHEGFFVFRESSFKMTRGRGGLRKFLDTQKGGSEKIREGSENLYTSKPLGGGAPKKN